MENLDFTIVQHCLSFLDISEIKTFLLTNKVYYSNIDICYYFHFYDVYVHNYSFQFFNNSYYHVNFETELCNLLERKACAKIIEKFFIMYHDENHKPDMCVLLRSLYDFNVFFMVNNYCNTIQKIKESEDIYSEEIVQIFLTLEEYAF